MVGTSNQSVPEMAIDKRGWFPYKNHDFQGSREQGSVIKLTQVVLLRKSPFNMGIQWVPSGYLIAMDNHHF